jgi:hypothetical protein
VRPDPNVVGLPLLLVLLGVSLIAWLSDPFTALLMLPALHLWLLIASPELRPGRLGSFALLALGVAPLLLLVAFYAHQLGLGPGGVAWTAVLLIAGAHVGVAGAILWSVALGCAVVAGMLTFATLAKPPSGGVVDEVEITIRGPLSYAGPGSSRLVAPRRARARRDAHRERRARPARCRPHARLAGADLGDLRETQAGPSQRRAAQGGTRFADCG